MFDLTGLLPWIIIIFLVVMFVPMVIMLVDWLIVVFQRKKKSFIERADDAHVAVYRKRRKAGIKNLRDTRLRYLVTLGDEDYYDNGRAGKIKSIFWRNEIIEVFLSTKKLRPWGWYKIPKEMVRDALGRNLRVKCNGFEPIGNFMAAIPTREVIGKSVNVKRLVMEPVTGQMKQVEETIPLTVYYRHLVMEDEEYQMCEEKSVEAEEQKVHAMVDALDTKRKAESMITRPDFAPVVPGTPQEGPQYDRE
jgi:hypothetical protein